MQAVIVLRAAARTRSEEAPSSGPSGLVRRHVTKGIMMAVKLRIGAAVALCAVAAAVYAATALRFGAEINVSRTATPTEKAKVVRLA